MDKIQRCGTHVASDGVERDVLQRWRVVDVLEGCLEALFAVQAICVAVADAGASAATRLVGVLYRAWRPKHPCEHLCPPVKSKSVQGDSTRKWVVGFHEKLMKSDGGCLT